MNEKRKGIQLNFTIRGKNTAIVGLRASFLFETGLTEHLENAKGIPTYSVVNSIWTAYGDFKAARRDGNWRSRFVIYSSLVRRHKGTIFGAYLLG